MPQHSFPEPLRDTVGHLRGADYSAVIIAIPMRSLRFLIKALSCFQAEAGEHYGGAKHSKQQEGLR